MSDRKRVLIVDDEEDLVEMLALRLRSIGLFEIETAGDGETGLETARRFHPDVVLLDSRMPGTDGWDVCRRLRADPLHSATAIVMMTAGTPEESQRKTRECGADGLVLKPYDYQQVVETLKTAVKAGA